MALVVVGCEPTPPQPTGSAQPISSSPAVPSALEDCEDYVFVPCPRQVARLSVSLAGSSFSLTYASDRVPGRMAAPSLDAAANGLGGWSLDVLHSYDSSAGTLVLGTGERRVVLANTVTANGAPAQAVPSTDGTAVFVFDPQGRQLATYDAITGSLRYRFGWEAAGLASVTEAGERVTRIRRDPSGQPIEIVSARGYRTKIGTLDGWLAAVADPAGSITRITSSADGLVSVMRDPTGAATVIRYDPTGRLIELRSPSGSMASYLRTDISGGFTVVGTTGGGRTWSDSVRLDGTKVIRTHVDFAGRTTTVESDGAARTVTTGDGTVARFDLSGDPRWGLAAPVPTNFVVTTPGGRRQTVSETRTASRTSATLDASANSRTLTIDGASWRLGYDPATRTTTMTDPEGQTRTTISDDSGRPIRVQVSGFAPTAYRYDDRGRLDTVAVGEGSAARVWRYATDRVTGDLVVTDPLGQATTLRADVTGRLSAVEATSGEIVSQVHDQVGRLTAVTPPGGASTRTAYRGDGRVDMVTSPAGIDGLRFTTFEYDADGLLAQVGFVDGTGTSLRRDSAGRITQVEAAGAGAWNVGYDPTTGAAITYDGPGVKLERTFDGNALVSEAWSGPVAATVSRRLDSAGRTAADSVAGGPEIAYSYDEAGYLVQAGELQVTRDSTSGLISEERLGSLIRAWRYDAFGAVIGLTVTSKTALVYELMVVRDGLGRVTQRSERLAAGTTHTRLFSYSPLGRLTSVTDDGKTTTYSYDLNGNLTREKLPDGPTINAEYDGRDSLVRRGTSTYTYDVAGRLATRTTPAGTTSYSYDATGHLVAVARASEPKVEYALDAIGRRIGRKVAGTIVQRLAYIDPLRPAAELDGNGSVTARFVYALATSAPTYVVRDGRTLLVVVDNVGTPRILVDAADGSIVAHLQTDALGRTIGDADPGMLPFGFAGGLADPDTGLVHFGARDYDASAGRWTTPDPIGFQGGDANLYRYAGGDPVNHTDPSGRICETLAIGIEGAASLGVRGSFGAGFVKQGNQPWAPYVDWSSGAGTPDLSGGPVITCLSDREPGASDKAAPYTGPDLTIGGSIGPFSGGYDVTYGEGGKVDRRGFHYSPELGLAPVSLSGETGHWASDEENAQFERAAEREAGCSGVDAGAGLCNSEKDPGPDAPETENICNASGTCQPDDGAPGGPGGAGLNGPRTLGDPHLKTADGVQFDFMAAGEFTALRSDRGDLVVQLRQVPITGTSSASISEGVAMNVNGDRLTFQHVGARVVVRLDGEPVVSTQTVALPNGGSLTPEGASYLVSWPDHTLARVLLSGRWVDVAMELAPTRRGTVHGLLGPYTGEESTAIEARDGTLVEVPVGGKIDYERLYRTFGDSWRITQDESLFDYAAGETTATFDDRNFPERNPPAIPAAQAIAAEQLCTRVGLTTQALADCIFDVALTGDAGFAVTNAYGTHVGPPTLGVVAAGLPTGPVEHGTISVDGPAVSATIAQPGAIASFTFAGTAGQKVYLTVLSSSLPNACGVPSLRGPDNVTIALGCILNGGGSIDRTVLPTTGQYSIVVDPADAATGDVQMRLASATDQEAGISLDGPAVSARIAQPGAIASFTFAGTAGQKAYVKVLSSSLPNACGVLSLRGPDNVTVALGCILNGGGSIDGTVLPATGQWSIVVDPADDITGEAQIQLTSVTDLKGTISVNGAPVRATIEQPGAIASFSFTGTAGQKVYVDVSAATLPNACGVVSLRGPDNIAVAWGCILNGVGSIDGTVLPASGQWSIVVDPADDITGEGQIRLRT